MDPRTAYKEAQRQGYDQSYAYFLSDYMEQYFNYYNDYIFNGGGGGSSLSMTFTWKMSGKTVMNDDYSQLLKDYPETHLLGEVIIPGYATIHCITIDVGSFDEAELFNNTKPGGSQYGAGEGNISSGMFNDIYSGMTADEIMTGSSSFLGYRYPNDMRFKNTRFVLLPNRKEVDMIHFMVVGQRGHLLGLVNEMQQKVRFKSSAFNPQDLYSNIIGVDFFRTYNSLIVNNPTQISDYIYQYFNSSTVRDHSATWFLINP